jgi:hypothetical protein
MPEIERHYPLPRPESDPRFCFGLLHDVAKLIEKYGYPPLTGHDMVPLRQALFHVIYAPTTD